MATFRVPVLVWQDFHGSFTAQAVTGEDYFPPAAYAARRDDAVAEVKEYLQWLFENEWWREAEDYEDLKLSEFRVEARPEYRTRPHEESEKKQQRRGRAAKGRTFAGEEPVPLRVACLSWRTAAGGFAASLPLFEIEFYFDRESELKSLVAMKVQEALRGAAPHDLARCLPPREIALEQISFQARRRVKETDPVRPVPNLAAVAEPLGAARRGAKAYEREAEIADLAARLTNEKASVVILGESGAGKTTVLVEAVRRIERALLAADQDEADGAPKPRHRFWQTNGGRLIAGMKYLGQWEERLEAVIAELAAIDGVLCAESLLDLVRYGGRAPEESLAAFLVPYLQRDELRLAAEATAAELDACRRLLPAFADLFQIVRLPEFTPEKALAALTHVADGAARDLGVEYAGAVVGLVRRFFARFMPYRAFPGRAPQFVAGLFAKAARERRRAVTANDAIDAFVRLTGLPELFLRDEVTLDFADVAAHFEAEVIGQPAACRQVAHVVTTFKAGLNDPRRPLGVFLFAGPTGVGKTELAKALARFFFGGAGDEKEKLVRLDMSEYALPGAAARLLTQGDGEPSELIRAVREKPFSVVLFDEVEKADAQVFDVLLGLFDEGRLTDRFGRVANFTSTVVIMTSNLGAERFAKGEIGFGEGAGAAASDREIRAFFRPEFFNRLDAVVHFRPLDRAAVRRITEKELAAVARREGLAERGLRLEWTPEAVDFLARRGFDPRFGARPLQRTIETLLTAPLAEFLLAHPELRDAALEAAPAGERFVFARR